MRGKATLTSRERVLYAMEHKKTDKVPLMLWIEPHAIQKLAKSFKDPDGLSNKLGFKIVDFISRTFPHKDIRAAAPLVFHAYNAPYLIQLGTDAVETISFHPWKGYGKIYFESGKILVRDIYGITRGICGIYLETIKPACETKEELKRYAFPDFSHSSFYDNIRLLRKLYPEHALCVWCPGVQDWAQGFYGLENLYLGVADHPKIIKGFFKKLCEHSIQIIKGSLKAGADVMMIGDDYGTQDRLWMSETMWKELTFPFLKKQIEVIHSCGGKALLHSCGHVQPLVKYFVEAELDALHPLQPTANNWKEVVRTFGKQLCFFSGIDTQSMINRTPKQVRADIFRAYKLASKHDGLVLCCTHYLQHNTPMKNIRAMFTAIAALRS